MYRSNQNGAGTKRPAGWSAVPQRVPTGPHSGTGPSPTIRLRWRHECRRANHEPCTDGAERYLRRTITLSEAAPEPDLDAMMDLAERTPATLLLKFV